MIDYHAHVGALQVIQDALDAAVGGSPHAATWLATKGAITAEPGCALLGTLLDHLFERSQRAQPEQALLEGGAAFFKEAVKNLTEIASLRKQFEDMIEKPATATTDQVKAIKGQLEGIQPTLTHFIARFEGYRGRALRRPFRHVAGHAIALDQPVARWLWRDVVLSRRTDAFIRALQAAGDGSPATTAFAFGALAGYAANAVGSSFISHAVGGPRRSHPIRDRVARYAVGAWLKINEPALCSSLSQLRDNLTLGDPQAPALPAAIRSQIATALATTYPAGAPAPMPNLDEGYATLLRHLKLLESFPRLAPVRDIPPTLVVRILQSPAALKALLKPTDWPPFTEPPHDPPSHRYRPFAPG